MLPVYITRIAATLPNAPVDNDAMENLLGHTGERPSRARRIVLRTNGIRQRHYVLDPYTREPTHNNASLTAAAVRALQGGTGEDEFRLSQLRCLVSGTSSPDQLLPNHGVMVHGELGNPACEVVATSGVCLAGVTALKYAWLAVRSGEHEQAVATGSETASLVLAAQHYAAETDARITELQSRSELAFEKDFLRWMLSDGAGAMLLSARPNRTGLSLRIDWIDLFSYAHEQPACMYMGAEKDESGRLTGWQRFSQEELLNRSVLAIKQDVKQLNAHIIHYGLERPLRETMARRELAAAGIDWFVPHMSSEFFREPIRQCLENCGFPIASERWFSNLATRGNTGSASIYLALEELFHSGRLDKGHRLLCVVPESGRFSSSFMHLTVV